MVGNSVGIYSMSRKLVMGVRPTQVQIIGSYGDPNLIWTQYSGTDPEVQGASAQWIWRLNDPTGGPYRFQKTITNTGESYMARMYICVDNHAVVYLNNVNIGDHDQFATAKKFEFMIVNGTNVIWIDAWNYEGHLSATNPAAIVAVIRQVSDNTIVAKTDDTWGWL